MKANPILSLFLLPLLGSSVNGAIVQGGSGFTLNGSIPDALILDSLGTPLATGFYSVGYFTILNTAVDTLVATQNFSALNAAFVPVANDNFQTGLPSIVGINAVPGISAVSNSSFDPSLAIGSTLYSYTANGTTLGSSAQYALYRHTGTVITADPLNPPANTYQANLENGQLLLGTLGGPMDQQVAGRTVTFAQTIRLVPEPSMLLLSSLGVFGLLRRKR